MRHLQDSPPPLSGSQLVFGTIALSTASFMTILDSALASVSISAIAGDLGVSPAQSTWVITGFGAANAIAVPLVGWLSQRFGQVRLLVSLLLMFVTASLMCGLAPTIEILIILRVIQGLCVGPIIPLSQTLLLGSYPMAKAGTALAASSVTVMVAPVIGPVMGGWLTDTLSWRWVFFVNVPIGLLVAALVWIVYRHREIQPKRVRVDFVGLGLLAVWVGSLQMMIGLGRELDWFDAWEIVALAISAVVGLVLFLAWELTDEHPVVDLRLFANYNYALGTIVLAGGFSLFMANSVLMPLWLQQHMGYTAMLSGATVAPVGILSIVLTPWVGRNLHKHDTRILIVLGLGAYALAFWIRSGFTPQTEMSTVMLASFVQGASSSFFFIPLQAAMYQGLNAGRTPGAVGLASFVRLLTGAVGAATCISLWESRAAMHRAHLVENLPAESMAILQAQGTLQAAGLSINQQYATISRMIDQEAFTHAATEISFASAIIYLLLMLVAWRMKVGSHGQPVRPAPVDKRQQADARVEASASST